MTVLDFLVEQQLLGNSLARWAATLSMLLTTFLVAHLILKRLRERLKSSASGEPSASLGVELVHGVKGFAILALAVSVALPLVELPPALARHLRTLATGLLLLQAGWLGGALVRLAVRKWMEADGKVQPDELTAGATLVFLGRAGIWVLTSLLILENFGIDVTALIAGLGIGGIAVALALQNVLGDVFASLSIVLDKPFVVGDFIVVGDLMGSVEKVGIKTTRLRSLSGEQLVFSNADLLASRVRNFKRMFERRVVLKFGVLYETPMEQLTRVPELVRAAIVSAPSTRFDRAHFAGFGASSLDFEAVYFVVSPDYNLYMDVQQQIGFTLMAKLAELDVGFAYPTQTIYIADPAPATRPSSLGHLSTHKLERQQSLDAPVTLRSH